MNLKRLFVLVLVVLMLMPLYSLAAVLRDPPDVSEEPSVELLELRTIVSAGAQLYYPIAIDGERERSELYDRLLPYIWFYFDDNDGDYLKVEWDTDAIANIDLTRTGVTMVDGWLENNADYVFRKGLDLKLTVDVRDGNEPCILFFIYNEKQNPKTVRFQMFDSSFMPFITFEPADGNYILWRSDDEGKNWDDVTGKSKVSNDGEDIIYESGEIKGPVWFCVQDARPAPHDAVSNVAAINIHNGKTYDDLGGDRTGVRRGGYVVDPTPTPTPISGPIRTPRSRPLWTPTPTSGPMPSPTATPVPTPMSLPTHSPVPVPSPTPEPKPESTLLYTDEPMLEPEPVLLSVPEPTVTSEPTTTPIPLEMSEASPEPYIPTLPENKEERPIAGFMLGGLGLTGIGITVLLKVRHGK